MARTIRCPPKSASSLYGGLGNDALSCGGGTDFGYGGADGLGGSLVAH
jgi:hypothetical protein